MFFFWYNIGNYMSTKSKKILKTMSPRKVKAIKLLSSGKVNTRKEALIKAGYSLSTADQPNKILQDSPSVQNLILAGEEAGLTDSYCLKNLMRAIEANDTSAITQSIKLWWNIKYPETRPYYKIDNNTLNVSVTPESSLDEAYSLIADHHHITIEELKSKLS